MKGSVNSLTGRADRGRDDQKNGADDNGKQNDREQSSPAKVLDELALRHGSDLAHIAWCHGLVLFLEYEMQLEIFNGVAQ
jgi:hypothetical protein